MVEEGRTIRIQWMVIVDKNPLLVMPLHLQKTVCVGAVSGKNLSYYGLPRKVSLEMKHC
jgi:hypothetical protein